MDVEVVFWDFDGVLLRSNDVREQGFAEVLNRFPKEQVEQLLAFHRDNGGLSRYVKFRYFFEAIRNEKMTEEKLKLYATAFSKIMLKTLVNPSLLIEYTNQFLKDNSHLYKMHIVSGSDQAELRYLCKKLDISKFFDSIHGSPTPKCQLVEQLILEHRYDTNKCILIGDSVNDFDAAENNRIGFQAFGNDRLKALSSHCLI